MLEYKLVFILTSLPLPAVTHEHSPSLALPYQASKSHLT
ncbi:hypothetical protein LDG_7238 [Legionella drancourtii LLAP12]|uniref:Uncharacterized protein n=1 Tax=Legionella drancourtii LLAP12 TaxID=658187 RepID=G9EPQ0_9GAMM|nr:hypothetical protein LDG_7238 [Legionella drancourtii LLAP12]